MWLSLLKQRLVKMIIEDTISKFTSQFEKSNYPRYKDCRIILSKYEYSLSIGSETFELVVSLDKEF